MTGGAAADSGRHGALAFRTDLEDFGAFYERTYQVAFRTALAIVRDGALAAESPRTPTPPPSGARRFRGDAPGHAWLHRIVVNAALASVRRRRPRIHELRVVEAGGRVGGPDIGRPARDPRGPRRAHAASAGGRRPPLLPRLRLRDDRIDPRDDADQRRRDAQPGPRPAPRRAGAAASRRCGRDAGR